MECKDFEVNIFIDYRKWLLDKPQQEEIRKHLDSCQECRIKAREFATILDAMESAKEFQDIEPSAEFYKGVLSGISPRRKRPAVFRFSRAFSYFIRAAAIVVICLGLYMLLRSNKSDDVKDVKLVAGLGVKRLQDNTILVQSPKASIKFEKTRWLVLDKGSAYLDVQKSDRPFGLETPLGTINVKGTEFFVDVKKGGGDMKLVKAMVILWVVSGVVEFTSPYGTQRVEDNQVLYAEEGSAPILKEEVTKETVRKKNCMMVAKLIEELTDVNPKIRAKAARTLTKLTSKSEDAKSLLGDFAKKWLSTAGKPDRKQDAEKQSRWKKMPEAPIKPRTGHQTFIWNGKIVIFGGFSAATTPREIFLDGAIYDIEKSSWEVIPKAPLAERKLCDMVMFPNGKLLVWGGVKLNLTELGEYDYCKDGAVYDIQKKKWEKTKAPTAEWRFDRSSLVLGNKLVIWGMGTWEAPGLTWRKRQAGAVYDSEKNEWKKIPKVPIPSRMPLTMTKVGETENKVLVWGGYGGYDADRRVAAYYVDGAIYDIEKNTWTKIEEAPLDSRQDCVRAFTGKNFIVWGGPPNFQDGAVYDIEKREWKPMPILPSRGGPYVLYNILANTRLVLLWGREFVFQDENEGDDVRVGAVYDIEKNKWEKMPKPPINSRSKATVALSGSKLVIWGGEGESDGAVYDIEKNTWKKMKESPIEGRYGNFSMLYGNRLITYGGQDESGNACNDGAIYDIEADQWEKIPESPGDERKQSTLVFVKDKLIIWGGHDSLGDGLNDGAIYEIGR
jgi:N-acetylneuraminic acid mutarotase